MILIDEKYTKKRDLHNQMTLDTNSEMKYYTGLGLTLAVMVFVSGSSGYNPLYKGTSILGISIVLFLTVFRINEKRRMGKLFKE